jgi:hypothetical protein
VKASLNRAFGAYTKDLYSYGFFVYAPKSRGLDPKPDELHMSRVKRQ